MQARTSWNGSARRIGRSRPLGRRTSILGAAALALAGAAITNAADQSQAASASAAPWYERLLVGFEVGPTGAQFGSDRSDAGYAERFDGREIVRATVEAGGEYLVIWARDGEYAYYDSKLAPKCPGLRDRDVLRESVEEAAKHGLPVIAYCVVQAGGYALREHPDWSMRSSDGGVLGRVCLNSGYLEHVKGLCAEMLDYGIDGFHIDMLDQGFGPPYGCWCETCQPLFEEEFGRPMPDGVTWDEAWDDMLAFRYSTSERFERELYQFIKERAPEATVDYNYHGNPPFSWEVGQRPVQHAVTADFVTGETGAWGFSALGVGLNARFYAAATPGRPVQVVMQRGVRMYHDQTTRPLEDMRWELFTLLSHGGFVTIVDKTGYDGWLDPVAYRRFGTLFEEAKARREHFGQPVAADVGIYFSSRTRDWIGRADPADYFTAFYGAHRAMVQAHLPWDIVLDENVDPDVLRRFPVVLLPNVGILSDREIEMLEAWVSDGGSLVVTGSSGQFDRRGNALERSAIERLVGGRAVRRLESLDNHLRFAGEGTPPVLVEGIETDWPFLVKGPATVYEATEAEAFGELLEPHRTVRQRLGREGTEWPMSAGAPVGPAVLINSLGKGRVLTFAGSPDFAMASEHRIVEARHLIRNAVRLLHSEPEVRIEAPVNVEAVVTREAREGGGTRVRVHFIGCNAPPASTPVRNRPYALPGLIEEPPIYHAAIHFRDVPAAVSTIDPETDVVPIGNAVRVLIHATHETVIADFPEADRTE